VAGECVLVFSVPIFREATGQYRAVPFARAVEVVRGIVEKLVVAPVPVPFTIMGLLIRNEDSFPAMFKRH
jgi:hypothetical protein